MGLIHYLKIVTVLHLNIMYGSIDKVEFMVFKMILPPSMMEYFFLHLG